MIDPKERVRERLIHITEACNRINSYVAGLSMDEFLEDTQVQDAVLYQLIIIGEAVIHIDPNLLDKYPYPWFKVRAFRNYAAHKYFDIQVWTVWEIVNKHVKELEELVEVILDKEF